VDEPAFGLYVHWPFCKAKCPYCDFNSHVRAGVDHDRWRRAFLAEIARVAEETRGRRLTSVFFGGGTPSLMPAATVAAILDAAAVAWQFRADTEITLEANPTSVEADRFRDIARAGVNRVSLGIQALDDGDLRRLGRLHDSAEALVALDTAHAHFSSVSFDLIYARQDQTEADWQEELSRALSLAGDHLSLYQLTIEPGTAFGARAAAGRLAGLPDEDRAARLYEMTQEMTEAAGLPAYEISNHARAGAQSRHNLLYWRAQDYVAIGPGAHGRLTVHGRRQATEALRAPEAWLKAVATRGAGELPRTELDAGEMSEEHLIMGLRLRDGISLSRHKSLAGAPLPETAIDELSELGLVTAREDRLCVTNRGRLVLNAVIARLLEG